MKRCSWNAYEHLVFVIAVIVAVAQIQDYYRHGQSRDADWNVRENQQNSQGQQLEDWTVSMHEFERKV